MEQHKAFGEKRDRDCKLLESRLNDKFLEIGKLSAKNDDLDVKNADLKDLVKTLESEKKQMRLESDQSKRTFTDRISAMDS